MASSKYIPTKFRTLVTNPKAYIQKTPTNIKKMAYDLVKFLIDNDLFIDTRIYYKTRKSWNMLTDSKLGNIPSNKENFSKGNKTYTIYTAEGIDPNYYFKYNGGYMSVSTEGPLYDIINSYSDEPIERYLNNYFSNWGLYFELGDTWNFSLYDR